MLRIWEVLHPTVLGHNQSLYPGVHIELNERKDISRKLNILVINCKVMYAIKIIQIQSPNMWIIIACTFKMYAKSFKSQLNWSLAGGCSCLRALLTWDGMFTCQSWRWIFLWWGAVASYDLSIFVSAKLQGQLIKYSRAILNNFILKFNKLLLEMLWYQYNKNMLVSPPLNHVE